MFQIQPLTKQQLQGITTPAAVMGGNMEAYPRVLYDTQTYAQAGSASLEFFTNVNADKTLSNMEGPGQLPEPKYFRIYKIHAQILLGVSEADPATALSDMSDLLVVGRPIFTLSIEDKPYGQVPLLHCTAAGGVTGFGYSPAASTDTDSHEFANNGIPTGGWWVGGALWLKPTVNFVGAIRWGNQQAVTADTRIRMELVGVEYRGIV